MGQIIKSFGHGHFHIPQRLRNRYSEMVRTEHPVVEFVVASTAALSLLLFLTAYSGNPNPVLAALAGTSAFLMIGFMFESPSTGHIMLNLLAAPLVFILALASLGGSESLLIAAFAVHALIAANQIAGKEKVIKAMFFCWAVFNSSLALLLV